MAKGRNKHGRTGVRKYKVQRPLDAQQKFEAEQEGWHDGMSSGMRAARRECLIIVNGARTIRDARRKLAELVSE